MVKGYDQKTDEDGERGEKEGRGGERRDKGVVEGRKKRCGKKRGGSEEEGMAAAGWDRGGK